jgi:hypothetical protein
MPKRKPAAKKTSIARKRATKPRPKAARASTATPKTKKKAARAPAEKRKAKKKAVRARTAKPKTRTNASRAPAAKPQAKTKPNGFEQHPGYALLVSKLMPGRYAGGMIFITKFGAHDREMGPWLMGNVEGRRAIGRTAFGDIVIFRDLRGRAKELGLPRADAACDVAMIDVHYKRMAVLADSAEGFIASLDRADWQKAFLRADLYEKAKKRLADYADDECFCFALPLAMGGSEDAASIQRVNWTVHQDILRQT